MSTKLKIKMIHTFIIFMTIRNSYFVILFFDIRTCMEVS